MLDSIFSNSYVAFAGLVIGFGLLIFVHELGHFLVAKWVGVRATQFAIGFGNPICSYRKGTGLRMGSTEKQYHRQALNALTDRGVDPEQAKERQVYEAADELGLGETEYRLNTLPLGGYVKMLGQEDIDPAARSDDPRSFNNQSARSRLAILSAGVVMNMIFGAILLAGAFMIGVRFPAAQVGAVVPGLPAANTFAEGHQSDPKYLGLRMGDQVTAVNGEKASDFMDLKLATALGQRGSNVAIKVHRAGEDQPLIFNIVPQVGRQSGLLSAGVVPGQTLRVQSILKESPAYQAGVRADMVITAVNGQPVQSLGQYVEAVNQASGKPVTISFENPKTHAQTKTTLRPVAALSPVQDGPPNLIGLTPPAEVVGVVEDKPAEEAGVKQGDLIARVGQARWPMNVAQVAAAVKAADGQPMPLTVWREGTIKDLGRVDAEDGKIGVAIRPLADQPIIGGVLPDSPASQLDNLPSGSRLTAVNGKPVNNWADLQRLLAGLKADKSGAKRQSQRHGTLEKPANRDSVIPAKAGVSDQSSSEAPDENPKPKTVAQVNLTFQLALAGQPKETVKLDLTRENLAYLHAAAWQPPMDQFALAQNLTMIQGNGPFDSIMIGLRKTKQFMVQTYITIARLFQGTIGFRHLRGPVGIVDEGTQIATKGFSYLLFFLGLISVNLAVINFLPIPIVDGGHVLFLAIEKVKGSPVSVRVQTWASVAGLVLIGFVFLTTLYYDVGRLDILNNLQFFGG